jgi:Asp-tRNA(Asn)/Glu-tRNA(Gln) amidotransferase A subunit family amidase
MSPPVVSGQMTIDRWREISRQPEVAVNLLRDHILRLEPDIHALVREPGRFDRLRQALANCAGGDLATVPIGIKDIVHVTDLETRAGSRLPPEALIGPEANCVTALKNAGAVILGKTVSTEFAYFAPGPTRNPHALQHTPGGSSSGSAAAVAAGYCPVALGTQTIGSVCRPAAYCGVVGFKPSFGRVSTRGVIPLAPSLDHVGIFTTNVADANLVSGTLVDRWNSQVSSQRPTLGIPRGPFLDRASAEGLLHFQRVCEHLQSAEWSLRSCNTFADFDQIEDRHHSIVAAEAARVHRSWFAEFSELYDPRTRELIERGRAITDERLDESLSEIGRLRDRVEQQMTANGIEFWISPAATGPAPHGIGATGDPVMNLPWTQAGLPAISLPAGIDDAGLPLGLQVVGRFGADEDLLAVSRDLERTLERMR